MFYLLLGVKMKADAYANLFMETYEDQLRKHEGDDQAVKHVACVDTIIHICKKMIMEIKEIGVGRKVHCDSAFEAIIREQNQKWRAIVKRLQQYRHILPLIPSPLAFQKVWDAFKQDIDK